MNINGMIAGLNKVVAAIDMFMPFASILGADKIVGIVKMGTEIADNIVARAQEANIVLHSNQEEEIDNILIKLREANDVLDIEIDKS